MGSSRFSKDPEIVEARRDRIESLTRSGLTAIEIAGIMDISTRTVVRAREKRNCSRGVEGKPLTDAEHETIQKLIAEGASLAECARTIGRAQRTVYSHYREFAWTKEQVREHLRLIKSNAYKKALT